MQLIHLYTLTLFPLTYYYSLFDFPFLFNFCYPKGILQAKQQKQKQWLAMRKQDLNDFQW